MNHGNITDLIIQTTIGTTSKAYASNDTYVAIFRT